MGETAMNLRNRTSDEIGIRAAGLADVTTLARLNQVLLDDEANRYRPSPGELLVRHRAWLAGSEWIQDLVEAGGTAVGYVVWQRRGNPAAASGHEIYVRQFCIDRPYRRRGFGRQAFAAFLECRAMAGERVVLDVLVENAAGQAFWQEAGFRPYATMMELSR